MTGFATPSLGETQRRTLRSACRQSLYLTVAGPLAWRQKPNLITEAGFMASCDWAEDVLLRIKRAWGCDPRGHIKSTRWTTGIPQWLSIQKPNEKYDSPEEYERASRVLKTHPFLRGVDQRILIASSSKMNAMRFVRRIRSFYESDPFWRWLFPELTPEAAGESSILWNKDEFVLPGRTTPYPEPFVDTAGVESKATSRHYDLILYDDPINEDNWQSEDEIRKAIDWLLFAEYLLENRDRTSPSGGVIFGTGNCWTMYDVVSFVHDSMDGVYDIWRRSCWQCSVHGAERCTSLPDCVRTESPIWPERFSRASLIELREKQGARIFSAQMENDPIDPDVVFFKPDQLRWFTFNPATRELVILAEGSTVREEKRVSQTSLRWFQCVDPATSSDPRSCRSAVGFFGEDGDGNQYFFDLWADRAEPGITVQRILDQWTHHAESGRKSYQLGSESVAGQDYLFPALNSACRLRNPVVWVYAQPVDDPHQTTLVRLRPDSRQRKEDRVRDLLGQRAQTHTLYVRLDLPYKDIFLDEWSRFPLSKSNDVIDMLAHSQRLCEGASGGAVALDSNRRRYWAARERRRHRSYGGY